MTRTHASHRFSARSGATVLAATRPLGRAALSCGLAGALTLGAAGAALAGERPGAAAGAGGQGRTTAEKTTAEKQHPAAKTSSRPEEKPARPAAQHSGTQDSGTRHSTTQRSATAPGSAQRKRPEGTTSTAPQRSHDPAGNNGTIKVDGAPWDARVDNEPHTSCAFRVTFFGFDEGQTADITVTGVAPTGGGVLLHETAVPTSDDAAGGAAHDGDGATRVYTADDLGLDAVTPHPQQGYHLKVAVDSREAPGGAKQKVLWLEPCEGQAPVTQPGTQPGTESGTQPETGGFQEGAEGPEVPASGAQPGGPATSQMPGSAEAQARPAAPADAAYLETSAPAADRASSLSALPTTQQASALPTGLAFTGAGGVALMALVGAGAAAAGMGLQVARRRAGAHS